MDHIQPLSPNKFTHRKQQGIFIVGTNSMCKTFKCFPGNSDPGTVIMLLILKYFTSVFSLVLPNKHEALDNVKSPKSVYVVNLWRIQSGLTPVKGVSLQT